MARSIWRGSISFGLVTIPVRLYPVARRRDVRFREVDRRTGQRVRHQRVLPDTPPAPPVDGGRDDRRAMSLPRLRQDLSTAWEGDHTPVDVELTRGYEVAPGRYVQVSEEDLAELAPERTKTIDVEQFVSRTELDPIYFETSYYVVPDIDLVRPFAVLLRAMQETNRAAICWLVLRSRRHLAAVQPRGDLMLLTTLLFADEVLPAAALGPPLPDNLQERELDMAELLVNTLAGPWEPERYHDEYRERVLALIERRAAAGEVTEEPEPPPPTAGVEELMAALAASVEAARARRQDPAPDRKQAEAGRRRRRG